MSGWRFLTSKQFNVIPHRKGLFIQDINGTGVQNVRIVMQHRRTANYKDSVDDFKEEENCICCRALSPLKTNTASRVFS
jgi:hypothetical protein